MNALKVTTFDVVILSLLALVFLAAVAQLIHEARTAQTRPDDDHPNWDEATKELRK